MALKSRAEGSRRDLLELRKKLAAEGLARNARPLWIASVVGAEGRAEAIATLLRLPTNEYSKQDLKLPVFQAPAPP